MSCGCKGDKIAEEVKVPSKAAKINNLVFRVIMFLVAVTLLPLMFPFLVWLLFKSIVLTDGVNLLPSILSISKRLKAATSKDEDDEEDVSEDEEYEYELQDVEEIKAK